MSHPKKPVGQFCSHPAFASISHNRVEGSVKIEAKTLAESARSDKGLCGLEAVLFEPYSRPRQMLRAFNAKSYAPYFYWISGFSGFLYLLSLWP